MGREDSVRIVAVVAAQPRLQKQARRNIISKHFNLLPEKKQVLVAVCCAGPSSKLRT